LFFRAELYICVITFRNLFRDVARTFG